MKVLWRAVFSVLLTLSAVSVATASGGEHSAAEAEVTALVSAVESKYAGVQALSARFVQTTHSEIFGDEHQEGKVTLKRPGKMRWEFTSGAEKQFITDGRTMWVYTKVDNQAIRYDNIGQGGAMDSLLQSLDKLTELFSVEVMPKANSHHRLRLRPKSAQEARFKVVELDLTPDLTLDKVSITDAFDARTDLAFSSVVLNAEAPDRIFEFQPPAGVEILTTGSME